IPFDHIKNVELTNFSATQPKDFNIQKLIRDQGYQDVSGPIRFVGRIDANSQSLVDNQIPGNNPRMTRYDKRSVVVETEVQDTPEFRSWLNNISGELEVLAPESLRKAYLNPANRLS
ncbi:MAG: WYL domain-containing protein, partial [Aeromonas allosaccharophila]